MLMYILPPNTRTDVSLWSDSDPWTAFCECLHLASHHNLPLLIFLDANA